MGGRGSSRDRCDEACPDALIRFSAKFWEHGLIVHDGGASSMVIDFCPWCGQRLPESPCGIAGSTNWSVVGSILQSTTAWPRRCTGRSGLSSAGGD
ncbi:DUF6980 family protein [Streptacidiphilus anmyonensis]|uniref:DUF6980 family protein n=1 Tax=Streptacidiphilus anmyonensis TaxID=405782 RepID=UPI003F70105D